MHQDLTLDVPAPVYYPPANERLILGRAVTIGDQTCSIVGERRPPHYRGGISVTMLRRKARRLRQRQTPAEEFLWELLRNRQLVGAKFRRQHEFGPYICDFYCHEALLVIECDGGYHDALDQRERDKRRDMYLRECGLTVVRFTNAEVLHETERVLERIAVHLAGPSPHPPPRGRGGRT